MVRAIRVIRAIRGLFSAYNDGFDLGRRQTHEHCDREHSVDESGAILRINDWEEGDHGGDRPSSLRILNRAHAWQSSNIPWSCSHESLCRDAPRKSAAPVDNAYDSPRFGGFAYLGFNPAFDDQET